MTTQASDHPRTCQHDEIDALSGHDHIVVVGAKEHNLRDLTLAIPKRALTVFTGRSGSGKSSLAFDTLFVEGRRQYLESLSVYARQFIGEVKRPEVDEIRGLGPTIAIDQRTVTTSPRSTVGTITEIYDFLRLLWARLGTQRCTGCGKPVGKTEPQEMVRKILELPPGTKLTLFGPLVRNRKGEFKALFSEMRRRGYTRMRVDGEIKRLEDLIIVKKSKRHDLDVVVDRIKIREGVEGRVRDSVMAALEAAEGQCLVEIDLGGGLSRELRFSQNLSCGDCDLSFPELSPQSFSFNSPVGSCRTCQGLGYTEVMEQDRICPDTSLSLDGGAILAWSWPGKQNPIKPESEITASVAEALGFSTSDPLSSLSDSQRKQLFWGTREKITVNWKRQRRSGSYQLKYEGIIPHLMGILRETSREAVKNFLLPFVVERPCPGCGGARLRPESRSVEVGARKIHEIAHLPIGAAKDFFAQLSFEGQRALVAREILPEVVQRLDFLLQVGLGYLSLDRGGATLSGGESQRIRLATQLGSGLTGVTYVLDEPSIGLHPRDQHRLLGTLKGLKTRGNTIIVVEHDEATMRAADCLIDFGPGAGKLGGEVTFAGVFNEEEEVEGSLTADYLSGRRVIPCPKERRKPGDRWLTIRGAKANNLKNVDMKLPLGLFTCVTGVSGAGKSTLVNGILLPAAEAALHRAQRVIGAHDALEGLDALQRVIAIDQRPIGRTPRSNPATYTKVFDLIRKHFSLLPDSRIYGYKPGRFSFNVAGGRCEHCKGAGVRNLEMHFLTDVYVPCEVCFGKRFNEATLRVTYRGKSISEVLALTVDEALELFSEHPGVRRILQTMHDVGLGYVQLGQPSTTLSGGEAQRVKLSKELARPQHGHTLYLLDEPSTGLHYEDIKDLLAVLNRLVEAGNSVVVIEHNLDIIKAADHLIDLGPEGGVHGGEIVSQGPPETIAACPESHTGRFLKEALERCVRS